jgi:nitroreductase
MRMTCSAGATDADCERIAVVTEQRYGTAVQLETAIEHGAAIATLNERSVCRSYRRDPIPDDLFWLLCATAFAAPSKSDLQQADIIRVQSPAQRAAIESQIPSAARWVADASELLVFCADGYRLDTIFDRRGVDFPNDHLDAFFNAVVDSAIVLAAFIEAAELVGLGSCPLSEIRDHPDAVAEILGLPRRVVPGAGLALGYPKAKEPLSPRLGLGATVHIDRFCMDTVEAELDAYDRRRVRDRPYRRQRDPARFGVSEQYGWTEEKFRHYSVRQRDGFGTFVRRSGYQLD